MLQKGGSVRRVTEVINNRLHWVQPRLTERRYELQRGDESVATLFFRSAFGSFATVRTADGAWTFKRIGFWQTRATVRAEDGLTELAVFEPKTWSGGGTLRLATGESILVTTNLWQSKIEFLTAEHRVLFRYLTEGFLRQNAQLEVLPDGKTRPDLPWLLPFGWYLVVMMHQDSSAVVSIIS
jgi:hypothetical protein